MVACIYFISSLALPPMLLPHANSVIPNIPSDKSTTIPNTYSEYCIHNTIQH